jgi:hypothetical protein
MASKKRVLGMESGSGVGEVALFASILANLRQYGRKEELRRSVQALQQIVQDWQLAYKSLDAQLSLALRTNDEQNRLIASLREQLRRAQARANDGARLLLESESGRPRARARRTEAARAKE